MIIGNGCDIAHNLDTKYKDFQNFLGERSQVLSELLKEVKNGELSIEEIDMPEPAISIDENGNLCCDDESSAMMIYLLLDAAERKLRENSGNETALIEWNNIEEAVGVLDFFDCFNSYGYPGIFEPKWKTSLKNEFRAIEIATAVLKISDLFLEWIKQVDTASATPKESLSCLIDNNTIVLSFNYTDLIEKNYKAKKVYHPHGKKDDVEVKFGHKPSKPAQEGLEFLYGAKQALD
ncbi:MAG: bacteriophage abortive infection AbiH family protein, partial [Clostridiales bacterium]|nr:bacteriophage abortive infection AbiH family protein [Clostridiales bacterium]